MTRTLAILFLSIFINKVCSQQWEQTLSFEDHTELRAIVEDYDGGTLLLSQLYTTNTESSTYITKLDINGNVLWSKTIGNLEDNITSLAIKRLNDGSIILGGGAYKLTNTQSSFLMKLNSCGELEWLKIIGNDISDDYLNNILILEDGNILAHFRYLGDKRISLLKITPEGEVLWAKNFFTITIGGAQDVDPDIGKYHSSDVYSLINTSDGGLAMSGTIYIPYLLDTTLVELKSFIMKLDSEGEREWIYVHGAGTPGHRTNSFDLIEVEDGFVVIGSKSFSGVSESSIRSHLYKVDKNGTLLWEKEQTDTLMKTVGFGIEAFDDGTFALMTHAYTGQEIPGTNYDSWVKVYKTDTLGNVLDSAVYGKGIDKNTTALSMSKTADNKILLAGFQDSANFRSAYALRIQADLSIDTFTNEVLNYDTLCNKTIADGFIAFDTALSIINIGNVDYELKVYPNPSQSYVYFEIDANERLEYNLKVYNALGSLVYTQKEVKDKLLKVDLIGFSRGIYYYSISHKDKLVASGQFVKE